MGRTKELFMDTREAEFNQAESDAEYMEYLKSIGHFEDETNFSKTTE